MIEFHGYKCEHCKKKYERKHACADHEETCLKNPKNYRACLDSCEFLKRKGIEYYTGIDNYYSGEPEYKKTEGFYCSKYDKLLMHPKMERSNLELSYVYVEEDEIKQEQMPEKCEGLNNWKMNLDHSLGKIFK